MARATDLQRFRFYADGTEAGAAALAAQDTNIQADVSTEDAVAVLRFGMKETNGDSGSASWVIEYSRNSGDWVQVTGATSFVRGFNSASLTDDGATTQRLTGGTGGFIAGIITEDGASASSTILGGSLTEVLAALQFVRADLQDGDRIDFRAKHGSAVAAFAVVPRATVVKGPNERFFAMFNQGFGR
jgi:hypothetical protein